MSAFSVIRSIILSAFALSSALALSAAAHAQDTYKVQRISTTPDVIIVGLNDKGDMVGFGDNAYLWRRPDRQITLPTLTGEPGAQAAAVAINDRRQIAGFNLIAGAYRTFILRHRRIRDIGGTGSFFPSDINNAGQIVGDFGGAGGGQAFLWTAGMLEIYDGPSGYLNDLDEAVGGAFLGDDRIRQGGVVRTLESAPGRGPTMGLDINNHSQVVGVSLPLGPGAQQAVFWQAGVATLLPEFEPGRLTVARSINDSEVIAGFQEGEGTGSRALVWTNGNVYSLTDRIRERDPLKSFAILQFAWKVNNRGQILVSGFDTREPEVYAHFLLTPRHGRRGPHQAVEDAEAE